MNQFIEHTPQGSVAAPELPDWALSHGITSFTTKEVAHLCGVPEKQVPQRLAPLRKRLSLFSPARGLWVPMPPEYRTWGAPDPMLYIDDMMAQLGVSYLVGWLTAAARYGASHQAPQAFQVATSKPVRNRNFGRSRLQFFSRSYAADVPCSPQEFSRTGVRIATAGMTMLMLAADPGFCGGINNVATAIVELADENLSYAKEVAVAADLFADAASRRLGYILDTFDDGAPSELCDYCKTLSSAESYLSPTAAKEGTLDRTWNIVVNEEVDPDL